jgi:gamma-glutamyltranspeptidase/glutathione hydrolase
MARSFASVGDDRPEASTTHISVIDRQGNAVAVTCTIEQEFGSAVLAPGTGFLLNNELTDFGNAGTANQAQGGKRPRSSMSPTIVVERSGRITALGGAGGARIIMGVHQPIVHLLDFGHSLAEAIDAQRLEAAGATLLVEDTRIDPRVIADLEARGHRVTREGEYAVRPRVQGAAHVRARDKPVTREAVSDPRTDPASVAERPPPTCGRRSRTRCPAPR